MLESTSEWAPLDDQDIALYGDCRSTTTVPGVGTTLLDDLFRCHDDGVDGNSALQMVSRDWVWRE